MSRVGEINCVNRLESIIAEAHHLSGHLSSAITYELIKNHYDEQYKFKDIANYVSNCLKCKRKKGYEGNRKFNPIVINDFFNTIGIDVIGPLPRTANGNRYIVLATDYATSWGEGRALKGKSAELISRFLIDDIFTRHGPPSKIRSDCGTEFMNKIVDATCKYWKCKLKHTIPYTPYSNGKTERSNKILMDKLKCLVETYGEWDQLLNCALYCYRISPITNFGGKSPFELLYGRKTRVKVDETEFLKENYKNLDPDILISDRFNEFENCRGIVIQNNEKYLTNIKNRNLSKRDTEDLCVGDVVLLKKRIFDNKFDDLWTGPYIIVRHEGNNRYATRYLFYEFADVVLATRENIQYLCKSNDESIIEDYLKSMKSIIKVKMGGM